MVTRLRRLRIAILAIWLCLFLLSGCGPAPAAAPGMTSAVPVEPDRASAAPSVPGPAKANDSSMADTLHITWLYNEDTEEMVGQLGILQDVLNRSGWHVLLDILPMEKRQKLSDFATDAFVSPELWMLRDPNLCDQVEFADPDKLLDAGATVDIMPLCAQYAPVLAEKTAQSLTASGVPLSNWHSMNQRSLYLMLLRDKTPQQWLAAPPAMTEIVSWLESEDVSLGNQRSQGNPSVPLQWALQAWAGSEGYYPLDFYGISGGFYAKADDPALQPVPLENLPGFDDMYCRLFTLYKAGKYSEFGPCPTDTVGYLSEHESLYDTSAEIHGIAEGDMVALPIRGTAWEKSSPSQYDGRVLAIPVQSQHARQVLELVQWLRTTREGYDLATYGIQNEDYTLQNGRLQWIEGSKMAQFRFQLVSDRTMDRQARLTNAADVDRLTKYVKLPLMDAQGDAVREANAKLIADRENLLAGLLPGKENDVQPVANADTALKLLREMNADGEVDKLAEAYAAKLHKLTDK